MMLLEELESGEEGREKEKKQTCIEGALIPPGRVSPG